MVTIGLPVYHAEKWVGEAIESILRQTYADWELIVTIDDGSDPIRDYGLEIRDERIRIVADGEHRGISARINQQVAMARGEFFARMDADDVMMPERLELQVRYLMEHPEVDVVSGAAVVVGVEASLVASFGAREQSSEERGVKVRRRGIIHPTVMGRTEWFRRHPYRSECDGCEDWDLWTRAMYGSRLEDDGGAKDGSRLEDDGRAKDGSRFGFIDEPLIYYRQGRFDKEKYLLRRRQGRVAIRMNKEILPWWRYYWLLADSYLKSMVVGMCRM